MEMPTSALTGITLKDMFDAGLHFGHQTKRWNPKMKGYIFDKRNGIHIIDLTQSVVMLDEAANFLRETILNGKKVLFVATKKQVSELVKEKAESVRHRALARRYAHQCQDDSFVRSSYAPVAGDRESQWRRTFGAQAGSVNASPRTREA